MSYRTEYINFSTYNVFLICNCLNYHYYFGKFFIAFLGTRLFLTTKKAENTTKWLFLCSKNQIFILIFLDMTWQMFKSFIDIAYLRRPRTHSTPLQWREEDRVLTKVEIDTHELVLLYEMKFESCSSMILQCFVCRSNAKLYCCICGVTI